MNMRNEIPLCTGCGHRLPPWWAHAGVHPECESQAPGEFVMPREPSRDENRRLQDWDNRVLQLDASIADLQSATKARAEEQRGDLAELMALSSERSHVAGLIRELTSQLDAVTP